MSNSEEKKYHWFLISYGWQYGKESGYGSIIKGYSGFNGKIGNATIKDLKEEILNNNKNKFEKMKGDSFVFFISSISNLGEMTEKEFEEE